MSLCEALRQMSGARIRPICCLRSLLAVVDRGKGLFSNGTCGLACVDLADMESGALAKWAATLAALE